MQPKPAHKCDVVKSCCSPIHSNIGVQNSKGMEQTLLHMLSEYTHLYFNTYFKIPNCNLISFLEGKERQYHHNNNKLFLIQLVYIHTAYHEKEKKYRKSRQVWPCVHLRTHLVSYLNCSWWHSQNRPLRASILLKYCVHIGCIYQVCKTLHGYNTQVGFGTRKMLPETNFMNTARYLIYQAEICAL